MQLKLPTMCSKNSVIILLSQRDSVRRYRDMCFGKPLKIYGVLVFKLCFWMNNGNYSVKSGTVARDQILLSFGKATTEVYILTKYYHKLQCSDRTQASFNHYLYIPKYRSSDTLPVPELFFFFSLREENSLSSLQKKKALSSFHMVSALGLLE